MSINFEFLPIFLITIYNFNIFLKQFYKKIIFLTHNNLTLHSSLKASEHKWKWEVYVCRWNYYQVKECTQNYTLLHNLCSRWLMLCPPVDAYFLRTKLHHSNDSLEYHFHVIKNSTSMKWFFFLSFLTSFEIDQQLKFLLIVWTSHSSA